MRTAGTCTRTPPAASSVSAAPSISRSEERRMARVIGRCLYGLGSLAAVVARVSLMGFTVSCGSGTPIILPTPVPTSTPVPICEALGKGVYTAKCKASRSVQLGASVDAAIDALIASQPQLFDLGKEQGKGTRQYLVVDKKAYFK